MRGKEGPRARRMLSRTEKVVISKHDQPRHDGISYDGTAGNGRIISQRTGFGILLTAMASRPRQQRIPSFSLSG